MNWKLRFPCDGNQNCFYEKTFLTSLAMNDYPSGFTLSLPEWLVAILTELPVYYATAEKRMGLVLELARRNALEDSGGPFAAGVFEYKTGRLVAVGVNRVVPSHCSSAHAEVIALSLAQSRLQVYDLGGPEQPAFELVVNWRPCAMCFGAVLWSGIRRLTIAGSGPELEALTGFDEGPMHRQWRAELARRGIILTEDVLRREAIDLFRWFATSGRIVYNARQG
jgi:tRNA(Arg) A34 adenosine deaminase TadA